MNTSSRANFVSEWYGYRVYPKVLEDEKAFRHQQHGLCPFLSRITRSERPCIKSPASQGVCTISSESNGQRQDWLVCPNRVLGSELVENAAKNLFGMEPRQRVLLLPASSLASEQARRQAAQALEIGDRVLVFFHEKLGGEISIPATERSPEIAFDMTLVEIVYRGGHHGVGRFGILEVQTMDFHGTYRNAVKNMKDALRLHGKQFYKAIRQYPQWLGDKIEGPNKANVFKRTFYQLAFKFQLGAARQCAGCTLAIPTAVWDSWQPHLGKPDMTALGHGIYALARPGEHFTAGVKNKAPARIYVFEPEVDSSSAPNPLKVSKVILTSADALAHYALRVAPEAAVGSEGLVGLVPQRIFARLRQWWPDLAF